MQTTPAGPASVQEEEDDPSVPVTPGTKCKRKGCNESYIDDAQSRTGNGEFATCVYHPFPPIFREGSKGYLCCKRRVLEFDEFLKIPGCKKGRHLFAVTKGVGEGRETEPVSCRLDHYQTPREVHVSVFAKQADKEKSSIHIGSDRIVFDILMPSNRRFQKTLELYGPVDPEASSYQFFNTKVEIKLIKLDARSWNVLEKIASGTPSLNLTFGVGGRTGTVGGKTLVLDAQNRANDK